MDPQERTYRRKRRLFIVGIGLIIWGAFAESLFFVIVGGVLIAMAFASDAGTQQRSDFLGHQPPLPTPEAQPVRTIATKVDHPQASREFEPGDFNVVLLSPGVAAIMVQAALAALLGITEEQAHAIIATRASLVASGISGVEADRIKSTLQRLGAQIEIVQVHDKSQSQPPANIDQTVQSITKTLQTIAQRRAPTSPSRPVAFHTALLDAVMTDPGKDKIATRRVLKSVLGLDLLGAYNAVEQLPHVLRTGITKSEAERIKKALAEVGAKVELKPVSSDT